MPPLKVLPGWLALGLAGVGGVASATQSAANAALGAQVGSAPLGALANNVTGCLVVLAGLVAMPSMRTGLAALRRSGLPWWAYLGGLGGAFFVAAAAYAVPVIGVAVYTIAQVTGASIGGLATDRLGLAPAGRLPVSAPRLAGAALAVGAVGLAQIGRPIGNLALGFLALAVVAGIGVALQSALNGRVAVSSTPAAATCVNFMVSTPVLIGLAAGTGGFTTGWPQAWPPRWYLYVGGPLGVLIVTILVLAVRAVGVLRTNLAIIGGQLAGALLLDAAIPGGAAPSAAVAAGAVLTVVAVAVSGLHRRPRLPVPPPQPSRRAPHD